MEAGQELVLSNSAANSNIFSQYIESPSIFTDKRVLTSSFVPGSIPHREEEIKHISSVLAPMLRGYHANNVFVYGTCGTGKTICCRFVVSQLQDAVKAAQTDIKVIYINCKMERVSDTEYRLFAQMLKQLGEEVPYTGLPTDVIYRKFFAKVAEKKQSVIIILDEIDALYKKVGDDFLYNITRANNELGEANLSIIGITNDISFRDNLDVRVKSSLSEEEVMFRPYNAVQLRDILASRAGDGFVGGAVSESVINKCAALAAQEHGDARRALDLLRVAGEVAERMGETVVKERHVDVAEEKIDLDRVTETVKSQPAQSQIVLYAIIKMSEEARQKEKWADRRLLTGDIFSKYEELCRGNGTKVLTQRRISDLIGELDMFGIINAKVISKGRHGRTREITLSMNETALGKVRSYLMGRFG
ncbi:MAG: orc1/cdc6 family replication initiation protein [Candidatus Aenigmarchaeota archaeon]|nr:orc1/cdc6 family replication initiation protein [Candidatus Aenigmarchaeota archaeon]